MKLTTIALALFLTTIGCDAETPGTCSPCGADAIVCTETVQACIEDGAGTCKTGGPGDLVLNADGTFQQEFGAYVQTGTWVESDGALQLTSGGQNVGNVAVATGTCQVSHLILVLQIAGGVILGFVGLALWPLTIAAGVVYGVGSVVGLW